MFAFINLNAEEILQVKSVQYEIIHWEDPSQNQNKWNASFILEDGSDFSFQAPDHVSADEFPADVIRKAAELSIVKERPSFDSPGKSWFMFENLSNGKRFKAIGDSRQEFPKLVGEDVYQVNSVGFEKEKGNGILKFFLTGALGDIPFTLETDNDVQQDYFENLTLMFIQELEPIRASEGLYRRQFEFYHPVLDKQVILATSWMGGPRQYNLSNVVKIFKGLTGTRGGDPLYDCRLFIEYMGKEIKFKHIGNLRGENLGNPNDRIEIISETPGERKRQHSIYWIKNLRTGQEWKHYEGPRLNLDEVTPIPQMEGDSIYHISDSKVKRKDGVYKIKFDIKGLLGKFSIELDTQYNPQEYINTMPLVFVEELERIYDENQYYRRQFVFFHPQLKKEIVLTTIRYGGPLTRSVIKSNAKTISWGEYFGGADGHVRVFANSWVIDVVLEDGFSFTYHGKPKLDGEYTPIADGQSHKKELGERIFPIHSRIRFLTEAETEKTTTYTIRDEETHKLYEVKGKELRLEFED